MIITSATDDSLTPTIYDVRIRGGAKTYLWGSEGITANITFPIPLLLHIRNDPFGEIITFGTETASGTETILGTLRPGQCVSISIQDISGVFAKCAIETTAKCLIAPIASIKASP